MAAIAAPEHHGIVESHLFDYTRYAIPGTVTSRFFINHYAEEDYFRLTGISPDRFVQSVARRADAIRFFEYLMNMYAGDRGAILAREDAQTRHLR